MIQRGVERRPTFLDDADREDLLRRLDDVLPEEGVRCLAWVLMPNHFHLVLQTGERPLWKALQRVCMGYAMYFNRRYDRVGHLVQNRFRSRIAQGEGDVKNLIRYVHANPLRAGIVASLGDLESYRWSGHGALIDRQPARAFHATNTALTYFDDAIPAAQAALRAWMLDADAQGDVAAPGATDPGDERSPHDLFLAARDRLCARHAVSVTRLEAGLRDRPAFAIRRRLAALGVRELRLPTHAIAKALGTSTSTVCRAARRRGRASESPCPGTVPI